MTADFGAWTNYRIPEDRSDWHPLVGRIFEYWQSVAPAGQLPGRQHIVPEDIPALWSRMWLLDIFRDPLRYRFRLCGSLVVNSIGREVTGTWLDEVQPQTLLNPIARDRFRYTAETGMPTWRRGPSLWDRNPDHRTVESCVTPLAADGRTVDKLLGFATFYDRSGKPL
ncbi:MAG TPA: PAS domain-containing protein [Stellaceae bacterium]|nr:PAS domain-containing protein [Stellaceae bacterium]